MGSSGCSLPLLWYETVMYSLNVRAISGIALVFHPLLQGF